MAGRLLERGSERWFDSEGEVCAPVESNLIRSRELSWRGAREKVECSELRDRAELPRNINEVFLLMPQISIVEKVNAK